MITSDQIHEKEFSYKMRGYNDAEVDAYLDQLAAFIDNLTKENQGAAPSGSRAPPTS